jgi:hypothetical protein
MTTTLQDSLQFKIKQISIMSKGGGVDVSPMYDEINVYDSLFMPMMSGNILITDTVGLSSTLRFDGSEVILIDIEKSPGFIPFTKSFRIYKQTDRKNVNQSTEKYVLHFISDEFVFSTQQKVNQSYQTTYSDVAKKILANYLKLENNHKGIIEESLGIRKVVIPNLPPLEAIEWCAKRSVDNNNAPSFVFFSNIFGYNYVSLSTLIKNESILKINFDPKNLTNNDALSEMSSARSYEILVQNDSIDRIRSGVNSGRFIGFDPITRSLGEKVITFDDHYGSVDHLNNTPNRPEIFNKDNTTNLSSVDSRKVLSIFGTNRKNSSYIKKYDSDSISKTEPYENFLFQRKAIFKNLIARRMKVVMPGNFQLTSGFNVEVLTSGFKSKSKNSENEEVTLNGKYLIVAARHTITHNKHETLIEIATDSTNDTQVYTSNPQQNELLKRSQ